MEISLVKPANTELTDLPKSENPPMKKATPESPCVELKSGITKSEPELSPTGTSTER